MKKILYLTTVSRTINAFLVPHIEMLISKGYKVDCACYIDKQIDRRLLSKGVKVFDVPFSRSPLGMGNLNAFMRLKELQRINNYDIVHVHTPIASIYGRLLKIRFPELKTVYTAHGYHFFKGGSKLGWLIYYPIEKFMAKLTDVTININSEDYEITKNRLKPKKCYHVNGVGLDLNNYRRASDEEVVAKKVEISLEYEDFIILMIAELNKNKNHIQLIKAIELLKDRYPRIKALCVGEGDKLQELKDEVKERGLENNVMFLGFRTDVNELISIADIGVLLSHREGLPRNIMELMASGRKVIATDIRGCRDIVCDKSVGTLVKVGHAKETAEAIERYYLDFDREFRVSDEMKKYDVENIKGELWDIYKGLEGEDFFMKRVLHILPMNKLSGAEKMALIMCKNMKKYEPVVVCGGDVLKNIFQGNGIKSYALNFSSKSIITTIVGLKRIIKENNIRIIHAHDNTASLVGFLTKRIFSLDVRVISHIHSCYPWLKVEGLNKRIDSILRPRYDYNILCGNVVYDFYKNNSTYLEQEKATVISNAIDIKDIVEFNLKESKALRKKYNIPKNKIILGFVGRLCEIKGIIPFINEFSKEKDAFSDSKVLLVGSGDQEAEVKELIKTLGMEKLFILTGFQEEVNKFYPLMDIFFLPSIYEGLPMVILEAMSFKKPVISMDVGSVSEVVISQDTGELIQSGDYMKFVSKLREIKNNSYLLNKYSGNSYNFIKNNYNITDYVTKIEDQYERVDRIS